MQESSSTGRRKAAVWTTVIVVVVAVALGAAWALGAFDRSSRPAAGQQPSASPSAAPTAAGPVSFTTVPADGALEVNPITVAEVAAVNAEIDSVTLRPAGGGEAVQGTLGEDGALWRADGPLAFNTQYEMKVVLAGDDGSRVTETSSFATVTPPNEANAFMYPLDGAVVGVGQPIEINFSEPVLNKDAVEAAISVDVSSGQEGAWHWVTDTKVRYRAAEFWAPYTTVKVDMQLFGVDFGNGMIGNFNEERTFSTHNTRLAVVDNNTKTMQVFVDGQLTRTFPVTLGDAEWPSPEGYLVVMEQHRSVPFRAESIGLKPGDPAYYEPFDATNASRLTHGGVFVHQALPGAMGALGVINVSHGCVGMSPEGAQYFMDTFDPGDVVQVLNTGFPPVPIGDGYGDWNTPWEQYAAG